MTRSSPKVHPAILTFTVGFRVRPTDKRSIKWWIARKLRSKTRDRIREMLMRKIRRASEAIIDLKPIKTHPNVALARRNAQADLDWANAVKAELLRMYPDARSKYRHRPRGRRPNRVRVGSLGREAQVFGAEEPEDDS